MRELPANPGGDETLGFDVGDERLKKVAQNPRDVYNEMTPRAFNSRRRSLTRISGASLPICQLPE
jgi:hypothetical protein